MIVYTYNHIFIFDYFYFIHIYLSYVFCCCIKAPFYYLQAASQNIFSKSTCNQFYSCVNKTNSIIKVIFPFKQINLSKFSIWSVCTVY